MGIALVAFTIWHRLSRALRQRVVPAEVLSRSTTTYRMIGLGGGLLGAVATAGYLWFGRTRHLQPLGLSYPNAVLAGAGAVVVLAALLTIAALRSAPARAAARGATATARTKRWAPLATTSAALVIPAIVGVQTTVHYIDSLDDFTSLPNICSSNSLAQQQIGRFIADPPDVEAYTGSDYSRCTWQRIGDDRAELEVNLNLYDNSRDADRHLQWARSSAEDDGALVWGFALPPSSRAALADRGRVRSRPGRVATRPVV